jgi:hypothetical protein
LDNEEEVDWREVYGLSFRYGDLGYGNLGFGPSSSEMAISLKPTGTTQGVNWDRVTATPGVGQNGKANEDKPAVGMPQKQKPVPDATTEAFSAIPTSSDDTLQQQNAHSNLSAYQANPPNVNDAWHIGTQKKQKSDRQPTESQSAQPLTPVERFRERLRGKALRQLYENELHILPKTGLKPRPSGRLFFYSHKSP